MFFLNSVIYDFAISYPYYLIFSRIGIFESAPFTPTNLNNPVTAFLEVTKKTVHHFELLKCTKFIVTET